MQNRFIRYSASTASIFATVVGHAALAEAGVIALAWQDDTTFNYEISLKTSTDNGSTWSAEKAISSNSGNSYNPSVVVSGSVIHVAWHDYTPGNAEIYYKRSTDNGATWSASKRLTDNSGDSVAASLAVDGARVVVVWRDLTPGNSEIYLKASTDHGATWSSMKRITNNAGTSFYPSVALNGTTMHLIWQDDTPGNNEIYYRKSTDFGATWAAAKRLTDNAGDSTYPAMAVSGSVIHAVWQDDTPGNNEIYYKKSTDNGATWSAMKRITNDAGISAYPSITVNGSNVHMTWDDTATGDSEIYYKKSEDGGATWLKAKRLTDNTGNSYRSAVAANGLKVDVTWVDETPGNAEIYYKKSSDGGSTWSGLKRMTDNSGTSWYTSIAR